MSTVKECRVKTEELFRQLEELHNAYNNLLQTHDSPRDPETEEEIGNMARSLQYMERVSIAVLSFGRTAAIHNFV